MQFMDSKCAMKWQKSEKGEKDHNLNSGDHNDTDLHYFFFPSGCIPGWTPRRASALLK